MSRRTLIHRGSIIAVSGLSSHPFGSWKEKNGSWMWLRDGLAKNPEGGRVLLYGYDTLLVGSDSVQDIDDYEPRPIVFIAHSLGGLAVKQAMHQAASEPKSLPQFMSV